ncbi:MAG: outer membrane protein assembly factor BamD [Bdellovibrionaceae bacterium]|nr:outer membrane protein assembly factor BamD [Pseudobdellovibrionaceae bacterium]
MSKLKFFHFLKLSLFTVFMGLYSLGLVSCASDEKKTDTAESTFAVAQEFEKDERFDEAIRKYTEVKNKYPYSQFATKAELAIADVYFKEESFGEAQINYQTFRELHPKHPQIDYVVFRIGLSFYNQLPETIDRDLTYAHDAISAFDEVSEKFPMSSFVKEAKEKKEEALKKLAEKEAYVGDFYFKRQVFDSALLRYEFLISNYPQSQIEEKALARAYFSSVKVGDKEKARKYLQLLKKNFPNSKELTLLKNIEEI